MILGVFPSESPFRVDQVMAAPWLLGGLYLVLMLLAAAVSWSARARNRISWSMLINVLLMSIAVFTLACWGTSDTKLNFYFDPAHSAGLHCRNCCPQSLFGGCWLHGLFTSLTGWPLSTGFLWRPMPQSSFA